MEGIEKNDLLDRVSCPFASDHALHVNQTLVLTLCLELFRGKRRCFVDGGRYATDTDALLCPALQLLTGCPSRPLGQAIAFPYLENQFNLVYLSETEIGAD